MAHHCTEAGLHEKAVHYRLKAGHQAIARSAMVEAVAQIDKGLTLVAATPLSPARHQQELDLRIAIIPALIATKGYSSSAVGENLAHASALAEQIDRPDYLVPLLYGRWGYHNNMTLAEEEALLARFAKAAGAGEMLNIHDLKAAYEKAIGHKTSGSTVYNLLHRHSNSKGLINYYINSQIPFPANSN